MKRISLTAAFVAALLLVAMFATGCGGGDSSPSGNKNVAPSFTTGWPPTATATAGTPLSLPVAATGTPVPTIVCTLAAGNPGSAAFSGTNGATNSGNCVYTPPAPSSLPATATMTATASNVAGSATTLVVITTPAATASITSPANGATVSTTVNVVVNAAGFSATSFQLKLDGNNVGASTPATNNNATISWDTWTTTNAVHTLTVVASNGSFSVTSAAVSVTVSNPNPVPTITGISPMAVVPGHVGFTLTVAGSNFVTGASILVNGVSRTTTFVSATTLTTAISASDVANIGTLTITVSNPAPGGGVSATSLTLTVNSTVSVGAMAALKITATDPNDEFGYCVKNLGNLTGLAGQGDSAIGICAISGIYVVFNPESHPGVFTTADIGPSRLPGFKIVYSGPMTTPSHIAFFLAAGGDINHDGINDIVLSNNAATTDATNLPAAGTVFAVQGGAYLASLPGNKLELTDPTRPVVRMTGLAANYLTGQTLADPKDLDGDGFADLAFAAPGYGYQSAFRSGPGAVYVIPGRTDFFADKSIDLAQVEPAGSVAGAVITRDTSRTPISLASGLGLTSVNFGGDLTGDGLPEFLIGDPTAQNQTPNQQKVYAVFGTSTHLRGKLFVEDLGTTFSAATILTNRSGCSVANGFCNQGFGSTVAGRNGSLMVSDTSAGIVNPSGTGALAQGGMVSVMELSSLLNNQVVDIRTAAAANLWDYSSAQEQMGAGLKDGSDFRLATAPAADSNRGKILVLPGGGLTNGNQNIATITRMTITGEAAGDVLGTGIDRLGTTSIVLGAEGAGITPNLPGKVYLIFTKDILF